MKPLLAAVAAALLLAAPAFAGYGATAAPYPNALIKKATRVVRSHATFKKAVLLEADGQPKLGTKVKTAAGIVNWRIVFNNQRTHGSRFRSLFISARHGKLAKPVGNTSPFTEDVEIKNVPSMTLAAAVKKLRAAGHTQGFGAVTLRYPLGPGFSEPLYIFTFNSGGDDSYWAVGTKTGKVRPIG